MRRHRGARLRRPVRRHHAVARASASASTRSSPTAAEAQRERWLPDLVAGRALAAFGLTEPEAGSDAGATRTRAELVDGEWVVDGAKSYITNSGTELTSVVTVTARTGTREDGSPEISAIMRPGRAPRASSSSSRTASSAGTPPTPTASRSAASGCPRTPCSGSAAHGFKQFLAILDDGRIAISALALGSARACLDLATEYAKTRTAFGSPIGRNQGIAFPLADLSVAVEAGHLLTYRAAWLKDEQTAGRATAAQVKAAAAKAKLHTSTVAMDAARLATQVYGGAGFMEEYPVARFYRDAKILEIGEGTSEVQRLVLARGLGLPVA